MNEARIRICLDAIRKAVGIIEEELGHPIDVSVPALEAPVVQAAKPIIKTDSTREPYIRSLMEMDWPETVPAFQLKEPTDEDQKKRAKGVIDQMLPYGLLEGKDFLDFGCGEGWITEEARRRGARRSDGYDVQPSEKWDLHQCNFTTVFHEIESEYDVIMMYDVIDHTYDPIDVMSKVKSLLRPNGVVYLRCHPWTSRHATHLFKQGINKAYFHLFLSWDEMREQLGGLPIFTRVEVDPITAYHYWFQQFRIAKENMITEPVSDFFQTSEMKKIIQTEQKIPPKGITNFLKRMEIQFVDYRLEPFSTTTTNPVQ